MIFLERKIGGIKCKNWVVIILGKMTDKDYQTKDTLYSRGRVAGEIFGVEIRNVNLPRN